MNATDRPTTTSLATPSEIEPVLKALASERRLQILDWLKDPAAHFPPQEHGDPVEHGACNSTSSTSSASASPPDHVTSRCWSTPGSSSPRRRKGWIYYRRDEAAIASVAERLATI